MSARLTSYISRSYQRRKTKNIFLLGLLSLATGLAVVPLFSVFGYVVMLGAPALKLSFFTQLPKPMGESGGGMANAFLGTLTLVGVASAIGIPWGISLGLWLSEYGKRSKMGSFVRFSADTLSSIPSIIVGLFVYTIVVMPMKHFSALAGSLALAILMIPIVCRTTEEILKLVPEHIREAGLALGIPRWKVILWIVLKGSRGPIATAVVLSIARVAGETAPLLFTSFNNRFWQSSLMEPIASLPVQIYNYAIAPYDDWHSQAWAGAVLLVLMVFALNLITRLAMATKRRG